jgi:nitrite reductase (NO-forming)
MNAPSTTSRARHSRSAGSGPLHNASSKAVRALTLARANFRARDGLRIGFGLIWAIDAGFKWQSGFRQGFMGMVMEEGKGQAGWMHDWFHFWINLQHPHAMAFAYATAVIETVIALSLIFGFARKSIYIIGALFSMTIWGTAEGFGGPYNATSTDIGAAVMYAVVFLALLALNYEAGASRFTVDYLIEKRVSWWHRVAEAGHRREREEPTRTAPPTAETSLSS